MDLDVFVGNSGDVGVGEEEEHKSEEDGKGAIEAEIDEDNFPLREFLCLSTGGK